MLPNRQRAYGRSRLVRIRLWLAVLVALVLALSLAACSPTTRDSEEAEEAEEEVSELAPNEIREYEGKNLSSVDDFRENSISGPQDVDIETYTLAVEGLVGEPLELTYDEVLADRESFKKVVTLNCVEGWSVDILWEGVKVADVIDQAGVAPEANTVIFRSVDGYSTSLPLAFVRDNDILMAYKMNDVALPPERGFPFQLVAESKWGYKWAKWITEIELSDDPEFRGYWESRGYSNDGDQSLDSRGE